MTDSITPLIMLAIFLAGTLWLGLRYKKGGRNITEYTVGNKTFTTAALVATIVATTYGGGGLTRAVETIYVKGLWYIVATVGSVIVYNLACIVTASRIGTFIENHISSKNHISMADTIGHVYGKNAQDYRGTSLCGCSHCCHSRTNYGDIQDFANLYK